MSDAKVFDVIITGGGPVGLVMALLLDKYDLSVAVFDSKTSQTELPRAFHLSQGTMEIFAKLGIYEKILENALPKGSGFSMKVSTGISKPPFFFFDVVDTEQFAQHSKSILYAFENREISQADSVMLSQTKLEELLIEHIRNATKIDLFFSCKVVKLYENGTGVMVEVQSSLLDSSPCTYESKYLVGCDGSRSLVRKQLGIHLHGEVDVQSFLTFYIESEDLMNSLGTNPNSTRYGVNIGLQTGRIVVSFHLEQNNRIVVHLSGGPDRDISGLLKTDRNELLGSLLDKGMRFEILESSQWHANQLIATHFKKGRVFLAGDAAHSWFPAGGFGMNTGLQDSLNLSWKIAAMCQGWSGPYLGISYQVEQKPHDYNVMRILSQNIQFIVMGGIPLWLRLLTPLCRMLVRLFRGRIRKRINKEFKFLGYQMLSQRHVASNICVFEEEHSQRLEPLKNSNSVVIEDLPGCRVPIMSLGDGVPIRNGNYDTFLLLSFVEEANFKNLMDQAATRSIPLQYTFQKKEINSHYRKNFYLIRPDGFISWRSDSIPVGSEVSTLLDRAVGWEKPERFNPVYVDWTWSHFPNVTKELCILTPILACGFWGLSLPMVTLPAFLFIYFGTLVYRFYNNKKTPRKEIMCRHKAAVCNTPGIPQEVMALVTNHTCDIGAHDIIVKVKYAALHLIDYKLCRGYASNLLNLVFSLKYQKRFPLLLGRDFAGEVVVVGSKVRDFVTGDKVFGCRDVSSQGTLSEYISVASNEVTLKPESLSYDKAASLPYAYLSAVSGLNGIPEDSLRGKTLLVCDVGTPTGLVLTQLLAHRGATVHVWCSGEFNNEFFTAGATNIFILREKLNELNFSNYSVIFDVNAGVSEFPAGELVLDRDALLISWTRPGAQLIEQYGPIFGTIQSLLATRGKISSFEKRGVSLSYVKLSVESRMLEELSGAIERGIVKPLNGRIFNLSESADALAKFETVDWMGPAIMQIT